MTCVSWLTVRSREHIECGVVVWRRLILMSIGRLVVMLSVCMLFDERSTALLTNASNPRKWWSTVKMTVFGVRLCWTEKLGWSDQQKKRPHYFWRTLTPNNVEIVFSNHTLVTVVQYFVLLFSVPALVAVCLWIWIFMVGMMQTECSHFFASRWLGN